MLYFFLPLLATLPFNIQEGVGPRLDFRNNEFVISRAGKTERFPVQVPEAATLFWPPEPLLFRRDDAYVVWDVRGLTIRQKDWVYHTWLSSVPTSPKLFSREEILETKSLLGKGERQMNASTLSGAYRDGNVVYLLARWDDKAEKPWAEALFKVELTDEKPKPQLLGRFDGLSLNLKPGKSALFPRDGKPSVWMKTGDAWGLGSYDQEIEIFEFKRIGNALERIEMISDRFGWYVERTAMPSFVLYRWDSSSFARKQLLEAAGPMRIVNKSEPWIAEIEEGDDLYLQNATTGARIQLPPEAGYRATSHGVLVWTPAQRPRSAVLFDSSRWAPRARWPQRPNS